jgi:hypothetical protein
LALVRARTSAARPRGCRRNTGPGLLAAWMGSGSGTGLPTDRGPRRLPDRGRSGIRTRARVVRRRGRLGGCGGGRIHEPVRCAGHSAGPVSVRRRDLDPAGAATLRSGRRPRSRARSSDGRAPGGLARGLPDLRPPARQRGRAFAVSLRHPVPLQAARPGMGAGLPGSGPRRGPAHHRGRRGEGLLCRVGPEARAARPHHRGRPAGVLDPVAAGR